MSSNDNDSDQGGAGRREVAWRVFAAEYDDADFDYSESDEERAPNYVVTPTGARINRLFVVGVLTEVEQVSDDVLRGRVVDPTGAFVLYAGQYQPDEMAFLENADPPMFVAVTGKARTFQPEDSDRVFTSIRPESINRVDADTRDRWVVQTAEQTLSRVSTFATALDSGERGDALRRALESSGVDAGLSAGIPLAIDHYGTTREYLAAVWDLAVDSARVVAGEIDADDVGPLELAPDEGGDEVSVDLDYSLTDASEMQRISEERAAEPQAEAGDLAEIETEAGTETEAVSEESAEPEPTEEVEADSESVAEAETDAEPVAEAEPETETEPETATSDELGEAPTSSMDESEPESEEVPEVEDAEDAAELQEEIGDDEPPTVESEQDTSTDESFEPETGGEDEGPDLGTAGAGDEMYEFDEEEREQIEEEHGLEFSSGTEVGEPGEADIETEIEPEGEPGDTDQHAEPTSDEIDTDELQDVEPAQGGTEEAVNTDDQAPAGSDTAAAEAPGASIGEDETVEAEEETKTEAEEPAETEETAEAGEVAEGDEAEEEAGDTAEEPEDLEDTVMETMRELNEGDGVERETLLAAVVQEYDVTPADVEDALEGALMAGQCYESGDDTFKPI